MKAPLKVATGVVVAILSIWLGAYGLSVWHPGVDWQAFPTYFTCFTGFVAGCVVTIVNICEEE